MKNEAVIVAYGRSACCRAGKGSLSKVHPVEYGAQVLSGVLGQIPELRPEQIDDVVVGCSMPIHQMDRNAGRLIARRAGLPESVSAQTINRFCSSGLQAIATAANAVMAGQMSCVVAGGVESMTYCFGEYPREYWDSYLAEHDEGAYMGMGETAERIADKYGITREEMDRMAVESHRKAHAARQEGKLAKCILPVMGNEGKTITSDEWIRPDTSVDKLATLDTPFRKNGRVTAATSSPLTDGAAFTVVMARQMALELGIKPLARFVGFAVAGCDATMMGLGPVYAVPKVMKLTGLSVEDMDVIELNEAFASQAIACIHQLNMPVERVNPYGGALALGHAMGATGAVLTGKALDRLQEMDGRYALVTMCIGGGMGAAAVFENLTRE